MFKLSVRYVLDYVKHMHIQPVIAEIFLPYKVSKIAGCIFELAVRHYSLVFEPFLFKLP
jgi:hypothetical protein